ncbi:hypothetical protein RRSWK_00536 [Rhodopirellula sp. SWK7]|nr:hypothetical protein RRSWK_00536 [Rhodopirellula sp. SWK7]
MEPGSPQPAIKIRLFWCGVQSGQTESERWQSIIEKHRVSGVIRVPMNRQSAQPISLAFRRDRCG